MKTKLLLVSLFLLSASGVFAQKNARTTNTGARNVIIYIGDGFGIAPKTATRMALGQGRDGQRFTSDPNFKKLALDNLKYSATVTTHSLNSWITDSAPGASVYAAGKSGKQDNEVISLDPSSGESIETILENAKKQGYAVGLVSTARITHATPAAFASHIWYRDLESYIAAQYIASSQDEYKSIFNASPTEAYRYNASRDWELPAPKVGVELDVILGGGSRFFMPSKVNSPYAAVVDAQGNPIKDPATGMDVSLGSGRRADDVDLVDYAKRQKKYAFVNSRDALMKLDMSQFTPGSENKLLGLFNNSHMNYEQDRQTSAPWEPSLSDMTEMAIKVLKAKGGDKGFFLMVESGRIDHLEHANTGGISVVAGTDGNQYSVDADKPAYEGGGDANYTATPSTPRTANVYASDYMIKEVLAFDYAVAEGRTFMNVPINGKTLLFTTSDHECGGFTVTGLHDEADAQQNGTKIRTYAGQISKTNQMEAGYATPTNLVRGDGGDEGWFPEYSLKMFQNKYYPEAASPTARRIVVAYGSNPLTNGNGTKAGGTPGNHTPQDIWVGAEDNTGSHAVQITGRGLLDNTALTPIMADFMELADFKNILGTPAYRKKADLLTDNIKVSPVPVVNLSSVSFNVKNPSLVSIDIFNLAGSKVKSIVETKKYLTGRHTLPIDGSNLKAGVYVVIVNIEGKTQSKRIIVK